MLRMLEAPFKTLHEGSFLRYFSLSQGWHEDQRTTSSSNTASAISKRLFITVMEDGLG
jgi:hypothetical protein